MESGGPTIEALPDQLLGAIVALAGKQAGPSLTLVSKRFQRLVYSEPTFWRSFRLTNADWDLEREPQKRSQWLTGRLHTLERTAHMVQEASLNVNELLHAGRAARAVSVRQVDKWLGVLEPGVLTALSLDFATVREFKVKERALAAVAELLRFTRLQRLELAGVATAAAVLGRLPQLCSLSLRGADLDTAASAAVFTQLTQLQLASECCLREDWALVLPTLQHLRSLSVRAANITAHASLVQLTQLRELVIYNRGCEALPEQWALILPALRHLSSLSLDAYKIPAAVLASMAQLTQLGMLSLRLSGWSAAAVPKLRKLRHLSQLTSFDLYFRCYASAELACAAQLTLLKSLHIHCDDMHLIDPFPGMLLPLTSLRNLERLQVKLPRCQTLLLPELSKFPALKAYNLFSHMRVMFPGRLKFAGSTFEKCAFTTPGHQTFQLGYGTYEEYEAGVKVLAVEGLEQPCALQLLLSALLPGGMASTDTFALVLDCPQLDASTCAHSPLLARVAHLQLRKDRGNYHGDCDADVDVDEVCRVLLRQAPRLTSLSIHHHDVGSSVPACIRRLHGLTSLSLEHQYRLRDIPPGPYLTGLTSLTLGTDQLTNLPHSLVAAQRLQRLVLGLRELVLAEADVDGVLLRLPRLALLILRGPDQRTSVLDRLRRGAPNLVVRCERD